MTKKIKILTISDHPFSPSGVGSQTKYFIVEMLKTGKFQFVSLGGALKHENMTPTKTEEWGDDWLILPVKGYGNPDVIRSVLRSHKPDILWFMTDPRFYYWLFQMENEIRPLCPMVYYHVWDNYPYPKYNKVNYSSVDFIASISKVTSDIVQNVAPNTEERYLPHAVPLDIFKKVQDKDLDKFMKDNFPFAKDKVMFFWNNRNARRKQSGTLLFWFKNFLDKVGHDKAMLLMHTDPKDPNGQELNVIIDQLGLNTQKQVLISVEKLQLEHMAMLYNAVDCTINISDAEGFGLATLESLACETPIVVNMTGGLQEQVTDGEEWFGVGIEPRAKAIIGSQDIPFIYEDRIVEEDFQKAMLEIFNMSNEERKALGAKGREYVKRNYNFINFAKNWEEVLLKIHEEHGSWETRKNHKSWVATEL